MNYMDNEFLLKPAPERRAELKARREFLCQCPRCSALGDDTRRFPCCCHTGNTSLAANAAKTGPCSGKQLGGYGGYHMAAIQQHPPQGDQHQPLGGCGGYHMAAIQQHPPQGDQHQPQQQAAGDKSEARHNGSSGGGEGSGGDDPRLTECSECGRRAPTAWVDKMLREEAETTKEVARLNAVVAGTPGPLPSNWLSLVRRLRPPHPHHRLAHAIGLLQWAPENAIGEPRAAAKALESVIAVQETIFGLQRSCMLNAPHRNLLGMVMLGMPIGGCPPANPPPTASQDRNNARAACDALRRAAREQMVAFGPVAIGVRATWSTDVEKDLLDAQMRLVPDDAAELVSPKACSFCGSVRVVADQGNSGRGASGGIAAVAFALPKCGRCGRAAYCCREHQAIQWPLHKKSCRPRAAAAPATAAAAAAQKEE